MSVLLLYAPSTSFSLSIAMCILAWDAWAEKKNGRTQQLPSAREDASGNEHIPACENGRVLWEVPVQSAQKPWWWCQACALSLSLSLSLSLFCLYSEAPPCADLRIDGRVFVSAAACPISVILLLAFWSILWKNDERDYLESKLIIDALFCFVDRFLYAIRTHAGSGSEIFSSGF